MPGPAPIPADVQTLLIVLVALLGGALVLIIQNRKRR
jgi:hypothetical protein